MEKRACNFEYSFYRHWSLRCYYVDMTHPGTLADVCESIKMLFQWQSVWKLPSPHQRCISLSQSWYYSEHTCCNTTDKEEVSKNALAKSLTFLWCSSTSCTAKALCNLIVHNHLPCATLLVAQHRYMYSRSTLNDEWEWLFSLYTLV